MPEVLTPAVVIVGAGPAGLSAAARLAGTVGGEVLVLEREATSGGIPRHCEHTGYGVRDLHRFMWGPDYARLLADRARSAGAVIRTEAMVTGWSGARTLEVTSPQGRLRIEAGAVVLATGARERGRPARLIAGDRPAGVYTTGQLQNLVHLHHRKVGTRAVVIGSELVSWSAVVTLRSAECEVVLMATEQVRAESQALVTLTGRLALRVPVALGTRLSRIIGTGRVQAVELEDLSSGKRRIVPCDTVVLTGAWIPDNELARSAGLELDAGTLGPVVDMSLRTRAPGVFAVGNLVHPVDTADVAALDGVHVAGAVRRYLSSGAVGDPGTGSGVRLVPENPFAWVSPHVISAGEAARPARGHLLLWSGVHVSRPVVVARQDGRVISRRRSVWAASPGRVFRVPASILAGVDPHGGEVRIGLG